MAFRDQNGKITIDEAAAQQDVKNLMKSKENLDAALEYLKEVIGISSEFSGNTGHVITENTMMLKKQIEETLTNIDTTINDINSTVKKYQVIDSNLKDMINSSLM